MKGLLVVLLKHIAKPVGGGGGGGGYIVDNELKY